MLQTAQPAVAQDMTRYHPAPGDSSGAPSPGFDALYDVDATRPALETCLKTTRREGRSGRACLGLTTDVCHRFAANETTLGSIRCAQGETDGWIAIIEQTLAGIARKGDDGVRSAVESSQKSWEAHRLATCRIWGEVFRGGSLARQLGADCMREAAGRRALDLIGVLEALDP